MRSSHRNGHCRFFGLGSMMNVFRIVCLYNGFELLHTNTQQLTSSLNSSSPHSIFNRFFCVFRHFHFVLIRVSGPWHIACCADASSNRSVIDIFFDAGTHTDRLKALAHRVLRRSEVRDLHSLEKKTQLHLSSFEAQMFSQVVVFHCSLHLLRTNCSWLAHFITVLEWLPW